LAEQPLLELRKLNRFAAGGSRLLSDISLRIATGDRVALRGKSGSGKTLLLRSLAALDPIDDHLRWQGERIPSRNISNYRSKVIYLQQTPALPEGTVEAALKEPLKWTTNLGRHFEREKSVEMLQRVLRGTNSLDKQTADLSGGETGFVAIVRALQLEPTVLLLDEPTSAMDKETAMLVETLVGDWFDQAERAYVWVTHDVDQLFRVANRTIRLVDGKTAK